MEDVDTKIQEAEIKLEQNDFAGAIEDYRAAAIQMPSQLELVLDNLRVAETQERLAFARQMSNSFPDSWLVVHQEARLLIESRFMLQAIERFTHLITLSSDDLVQARRTRWGRLEASMSAGAYIVFVEDFLWLWQAATLPVLKRGLLRFLAQVGKADFVPVLERLLEADCFPQDVRRFVQAKIDELSLLATVSESFE